MSIILIGYGGHSYGIIDILSLLGKEILGYCAKNPNLDNPFDLEYLGPEDISLLKQKEYFISVGDNKIREAIYAKVKSVGWLINILSPTSFLSSSIKLKSGIFVGSGAIINARSAIFTGVIVNTGAIIEHDCIIYDFAHIGPGAVLSGNVSIGKRSFIGANSVIKQGVAIGSDVIVGAGAVILKDIPDNVVVVGNPGKIIKANI